MTTLTVTAKGQVTLKKDLLKHLGVQPGQRLEVDLLPGGGLPSGLKPGMALLKISSDTLPDVPTKSLPSKR